MKITKNNSKKILVSLLALVLVVGLTIGGTIAWLTDKTEEVVNTFTYGDINITLTENTGTNYKILPGNDIPKDPKVTVEVGSEASWLFVKVVETNWPTFKNSDETRKVDWKIVDGTDGWTALTGVTGVYYREWESSKGYTFPVLKDNQVIVSDTLTKAEVDTVKANLPTLTFTAYAVQRDGTNLNTPAAAWAVANQ